MSVGAKRVCSTVSKDALRRHGSGDPETIAGTSKPQVHSAAHPKSLSAEDWTLHLDAGESAIFRPDGVTVEPVTHEEVERRFAWARKILYIDGALSDAVAEFNQYSVRKIQIANDRLKHMRISGCFEVTDQGSFIEALSQSSAVTDDVTNTGDNVGAQAASDR